MITEKQTNKVIIFEDKNLSVTLKQKELEAKTQRVPGEGQARENMEMSSSASFGKTRKRC